MIPKTIRPVLAELVGTLLFVFFGCLSVIANGISTGGLGTLGVAAVHGAAIAVLASAFLSISGAHLNPAVTAGMFAARKVDGRTALAYVGAQLAGAVLAALLVKLVAPPMAARITALGAPQFGTQTGILAGVVIEALGAFAVVSVMFGTVISQSAPRLGGLAIGLTVFAVTLAAAPLSGGVFNPARAFGPALVSWYWATQVWYWVGPLLGGVLAGLAWKLLFLPRDPTQVE